MREHVHANAKRQSGAGAASPRPVLSSPPNAMLARALTGVAHVTYGPLHPLHGTATSMHAELRGVPLPGSKPTVEPAWWPRAGTHAHAPTVTWFSNYMVQGHLLNEHVGGPGNTLQNLAPLTKKANSAHHAAAEKNLKTEFLKNGNLIEYDVSVEYPTPTTGVTGEGLGLAGVTAKDVTTNFGQRLPKVMSAGVQVYDPASKWLYGEDWIVKNEAHVDH